jgi:hypothetical protein
MSVDITFHLLFVMHYLMFYNSYFVVLDDKGSCIINDYKFLFSGSYEISK